MPSYKLTGWLEEAARVLVFKESDWSLEKTEALPAGDFVIGDLLTGEKMVAGRRETDGKVEVYGNVTPILNTDFVSSWDTTKTNPPIKGSPPPPTKIIALPLFNGGTYNFTVDYGDNTGLKTITSWNDADATHTYANHGTYTVTISGQIEGFRFNGLGYVVKLVGISNWGTLKVGTNQGSYFYGCTNLVVTATDILDTSEITNMSYMFFNCPLFNGSVSSFNTSNVTNMSFMFSGCSVFNQSVANFDTSKVTSMNRMFYGCTAFNGSVSSFNTSLVTDMSEMFAYCSDFNYPVANFDTSKVTNMSAMFSGCSVFNQSVANFDTSKVTSMFGMFTECYVFNQPVTNFDTSLVTNMSMMFYGCSVFNQSVANFNTSLVTIMGNMFTGANALSQTNYDALLISWAARTQQTGVSFGAGDAQYSTGAATTARGVLTGTYGWIITDGGQLNTDFVSSWDTTKAGGSPAKTIALPLFSGPTYNFTVDYGDNSGEKTVTAYNDADAAHTYADDGTYTVTIKGQIDGFRFNNSGDKLRLIGISNWGTLKVGTNQGAYFYGCENLVVTATDILDTSEITNMSRMFSNCSVFNGSVSSFDTSAVTNMNYMFYDSMFNQSVANFNTAAVTNMNSMFRNCPMFNQSVANFNTANVTDMGRMFTACSEFNQSVANFNTTKVTNMVAMFAACSMFNQSLANFDTALVTDMSSMFYGCSVFNQSLANFDTLVVKWMNGMFSGCSAFNQSLDNFDTSKVTNMYSMFQNCLAFNQSLANFNTSAVEDMNCMFAGCSAFNQSVSTFNTALVTDMSEMFENCAVFNQSVTNFNTSAVTNMTNMFYGCSVFNQSLANFDTSNVTSMTDMFNGANAWYTANYDATLIAWSAITQQSNVPFHAGDVQYSIGDAEDARNVLSGTYGWTITDGGRLFYSGFPTGGTEYIEVVIGDAWKTLGAEFDPPSVPFEIDDPIKLYKVSGEDAWTEDGTATPSPTNRLRLVIGSSVMSIQVPGTGTIFSNAAYGSFDVGSVYVFKEVFDLIPAVVLYGYTAFLTTDAPLYNTGIFKSMTFHSS